LTGHLWAADPCSPGGYLHTPTCGVAGLDVSSVQRCPQSVYHSGLPSHSHPSWSTPCNSSSLL